jgi:DNA-binding NarL/FixJ family response regulator
MSAILLSADLLGTSQFTGAAARAGCQLTVAPTSDALFARLAAAPARLVVIDLSTTRSDLAELVARLRGLTEPPAAVLAFGPHVHEDRLQSARDAGCDAVMSRGQFHATAVAVFGQYAD